MPLLSGAELLVLLYIVRRELSAGKKVPIACEIRARKFYTTRHTFISDALSYGVNIKWLAEYCGTSVAMIEEHYGPYIKSDSEEQLKRVFEREAGTFAGTQRNESSVEETEVVKKISGKKWSGRVDLNHRLHGPEPCALPS